MKSTRLFQLVVVSRVLLAGLALSGALAPELYASECLFGECRVNTTNDTHDTNLGEDRFCADRAGDCSLRAAIETCNAGFADRIRVPSGTYRLTMGGDPVDATIGELKITTSLAIEGAGSVSTVIDGGHDFDRTNGSRVFEVSNAGANPVVEIFGVTITRGRGGGSTGGGIEIGEGCSLHLNKSNVTFCQALGGGGITNHGHLELIACKVNGNRAGRGGGGSEKELAGGITNEASGQARIIASEISGNCGTRGGGIENLGRLEISESKLTNNHAIHGGAIINGNFDIDHPAHLDISNSSIEDNIAAEETAPRPCDNVDTNIESVDWNGGAISNGALLHRRPSPTITSFGDVQTRSSTITRNHAIRGGGIANGDGGHAVIDWSTISGNTATRGGGIYNTGPGRRFLGVVELTYSTITKNRVSGLHVPGPPFPNVVGGGISNEAFVVMEATILAGNRVGTFGDNPDDCFSRTDESARPIASFCNNLFGVLDDNCNLEELPPCDYFGTPAAPLDPWLQPRWLDPLANNGGPTQTHALLQNSPAINAVVLGPGNHFCPDTDQRGRLRPAGPFCDIGAYEFNASLP